MREETGHDNTGDGRIAERAYAADASDETKPTHPHECPACTYLGCHAGGGHRFDLYLCAGAGAPLAVTRFGASPQAWAARDARHAPLYGLYHSDHALRRAVALACGSGKLPPEPPLRAERPALAARAEVWTRNTYPLDELPPPAELKTARVKSITAAPRAPAPPEPPAEPGMYILVPDSFPAECDVTLTLFGYFAEHRDPPSLHEFHVWPTAHVARAEEAYAEARAAGGLAPFAIARRTYLQPGPAERPQLTLAVKRPAAADDDAQPSGQFRCRACHTKWDGGQLLRSPYHHDRTTWVCPDTTCGAMVDKC